MVSVYMHDSVVSSSVCIWQYISLMVSEYDEFIQVCDMKVVRVFDGEQDSVVSSSLCIRKKLMTSSKSDYNSQCVSAYAHMLLYESVYTW